jgi:hypothetical protein
MCRNEEHTSSWNHFSIFLGQLLPCQLHNAELSFIQLCQPLGQSSDLAFGVINLVVEVSDNVMHSNGMPCRYPLVPGPEWPKNLYRILDTGLHILDFEEWPVITSFWIFKPLTSEFR